MHTRGRKIGCLLDFGRNGTIHPALRLPFATRINNASAITPSLRPLLLARLSPFPFRPALTNTATRGQRNASSNSGSGRSGVKSFDESKYPPMTPPQPLQPNPLAALDAPDIIPLLPDDNEGPPSTKRPRTAGGLLIESDHIMQEDEEVLAGKKAKDRKCPGCGAKLQSEDPHAVGYKPAQVKREQQGETPVCLRCHSLRHHGIVTPLKIPYEEVKEHLKLIADQSCLVVKIVDIFDFSGSFINDFRDITGNNPVVLVGNKMDLLPVGAKPERIQIWLKRLTTEMGLKNVRSVHLISAKTGEGVHSLSRKIEQLRKERDVFVVGCTNVGKSTLINRLISINTKGPKKNSLITTSIVPGTTLNLISFPLGGKAALKAGKRAYLYDTPGVINKHQMANLLTVDELRITLPKKRIQPVTYRLVPGKSIFFGGLGRLDYVDGPGPLYLTLFLSKEMRVHPTSLAKADELMAQHSGTLLVPPLGSDRVAQMPSFVAKDIRIPADKGMAGLKKAFADIVFSGLGWTSLVTPKFDRDVHLRSVSPEGVGIFLREPLMPFEIEKRKQTPGGIRKHGKVHKPSKYPHDQKEAGAQHEQQQQQQPENDAVDDFDVFDEEDEEEDESATADGSSPMSEGRTSDVKVKKKKKVSERRKRRLAFLARNRNPAWRALVKARKANKRPKT